MPHTVSVTELVRHFADYVNRVAYRGERFRLTRGGKLVAELGPVAGGTRECSLMELPALVATLPSLSEDEAARFSADLDEVCRDLTSLPPRDPWTS